MAKPSITPKGTLVYPHLNSPDTKFDKDGVFTTGLRLPASLAQPLISEIDAAITAQVEKVKAEKAKAAGKAPSQIKVKMVDAPYTVDDETGDVTFKFKLKASGTRRDGTVYTQKPTLVKFDTTPIPSDTAVWGGSEGKVAYEMHPFFSPGIGAGVSLRLKGVQIVKLVSGGGGDCGFTAAEDEGGFEDVSEAGEAFTNDSDADDDGDVTEDAGADAADF